MAYRRRSLDTDTDTNITNAACSARIQPRSTLRSALDDLSASLNRHGRRRREFIALVSRGRKMPLTKRAYSAGLAAATAGLIIARRSTALYHGQYMAEKEAREWLRWETYGITLISFSIFATSRCRRHSANFCYERTNGVLTLSRRIEYSAARQVLRRTIRSIFKKRSSLASREGDVR